MQDHPDQAGRAEPHSSEGQPSAVTSIFPLELKWPEAPSLDMPTIEVLQVRHTADHSSKLAVPAFAMLLAVDWVLRTQPAAAQRRILVTGLVPVC